MIMSELKRHYTNAKIFRFFFRHRYIYPTIARDLLEKKLRLSPFVKPRNIVLKLLAACNAKCRFCYAQYETGHREASISLDDWKKIITETKRLGCYTVTLSGGEPLIYPHIIELVEYIKSMRMIPFTTTNGIAASPGLLRELARAGLCALELVHARAQGDS